jgi:hypothetical protein
MTLHFLSNTPTLPGPVPIPASSKRACFRLRHSTSPTAAGSSARAQPKLAYRSQRQSPHDRALSQAFKHRRRLGSTASIGDPIDKLKDMRWATFDRKMEQIEAAEAVCNAHLFHVVQHLTQRRKR